jgi:hypothetical protein
MRILVHALAMTEGEHVIRTKKTSRRMSDTQCPQRSTHGLFERQKCHQYAFKALICSGRRMSDLSCSHFPSRSLRPHVILHNSLPCEDGKVGLRRKRSRPFTCSFE